MFMILIDDHKKLINTMNCQLISVSCFVWKLLSEKFKSQFNIYLTCIHTINLDNR